LLFPPALPWSANFGPDRRALPKLVIEAECGAVAGAFVAVSVLRGIRRPQQTTVDLNVRWTMKTKPVCGDESRLASSRKAWAKPWAKLG